MKSIDVHPTFGRRLCFGQHRVPLPDFERNLTRLDGAIHMGELSAAFSAKEIWGMSLDPNQRELLVRVVNWKNVKGPVKEKWGKLTDDQLDKMNGRREQLESKIQESYGIAKDQAKKDVHAWYNSMKW